MKARAAARTEQGTVTIFMAVLARGLLFAAGLALDGGRKLGALSEARDLADNAARVGAQQIDRDAWRLTGVPNIDPGAASAEANAYLAATGHQAPVIDGFSGDQRFFIGFGQIWATKMREQALRRRIATDAHAPGQYRALTVRNLDAWYDTFDVSMEDGLYLAPADRVRIW
jgi:predicted metalloendopeptidase